MNLTVSGEELLYLSALAGVDNIWGLEDPFAGVGEGELLLAMLRLQEALTARGLLTAEADGQLSMTPECRELLRHCMESERAYLLNSTLAEEEGQVLRFFVHGDRAVRFCFRGEAELAFTTPLLMKAELETFFGDAPEGENAASLVTGIARLRRMGSLSRRRFLEELRSIGCEEELALLIADGMQGDAAFCSLLAFDRSGEEERLADKLVALRFSGGSLMITPGDQGIDAVCFTRLSHSRLQEQLGRILGVESEAEAV